MIRPGNIVRTFDNERGGVIWVEPNNVSALVWSPSMRLSVSWYLWALTEEQ